MRSGRRGFDRTPRDRAVELAGSCQNCVRVVACGHARRGGVLLSRRFSAGSRGSGLAAVVRRWRARF